MSGKRVDIIKGRACAFLDLARELINRRPDSSFSVHQAHQLRIKASLLRLTGEMPRLHGIRELLGMLARKLKDLDLGEDALRIVDFVRRRRDALIDIEAAYIESRYGAGPIAKGIVEEMLGVAEELFKLLRRGGGACTGLSTT